MTGWNETPGAESHITGNIMCIQQVFVLKRSGNDLIVDGEVFIIDGPLPKIVENTA